MWKHLQMCAVMWLFHLLLKFTLIDSTIFLFRPWEMAFNQTNELQNGRHFEEVVDRFYDHFITEIGTNGRLLVHKTTRTKWLGKSVNGNNDEERKHKEDWIKSNWQQLCIRIHVVKKNAKRWFYMQTKISRYHWIAT